MVLSTAIPIDIAAIVIVIISSGILSNPIIPRIKVDAKIFGIIPIILNLRDLNNITNIIKIVNITKPNDFICELNKDFNILLYNTNNPLTLYSSKLLNCNAFEILEILSKKNMEMNTCQKIQIITQGKKQKMLRKRMKQ